MSSNSTAFETTNPISQTPLHFRPLRYGVQVEVDELFGINKAKKAFHHRDEDGKLWFDGLEEEEFRHLLRKNSNPAVFGQSPIYPISDYFSRRSSGATFSSFSAPTSPLSPFSNTKSSPFSALMTNLDGIPSSPMASMRIGMRRRSSISTQTILMMKEDQKESRRASVSFGKAKNPSNFNSIIDPFTLEKFNRIQCFPTIQQNTIYERRRRKRCRSNEEDVQEGQNPNKVNFNQFRSNIFQQVVHKVPQSSSKADIQMPSFLPISRHQIDSKALDEAFGYLRREDGQSKNSKMINDQYPVYSPTISDSSSISPFSSNQDLKDTLNSKNQPDQKQPPSTHFTNPFSKSEPNPSSMVVERPKVASILGMTALNESLLVPGGLGTGEHVYDGVEIPCASVRLQSDDEDECQTIAKSNQKPFKLRRESSKRTSKGAQLKSKW